MSLAGLDTPAVVDAHHVAQTEPTGWFLVKYVTRDTVQLLKRGIGGVTEARAAVDGYEEVSPLFGLVQYRRKKIILKYVPEGTSRLLQVRLTVQFQSVLDAFSPHDTIFSFALPSELTESALALCTMLLPASNSSTTSGSSLRRHRLNEISEDGEERNVALQRGSVEPDIVEGVASTDYGKRDVNGLPQSAILAKAMLAKRKELSETTPVAASSSHFSNLPGLDRARPIPRPEKRNMPSPITNYLSISTRTPVEKALPATPEPTPPNTGRSPKLTSPTLQSAFTEPQRTPAVKPHTSATDQLQLLSPAESDSISQWSSQVAPYSPIKPKKKKLAPRPHVEPASRPRTSGTSGASDSTVKSPRPVANLPTSVRAANRVLSPTPTPTPTRPGSQHSTKSTPGRFHPVDHTQTLPPLPSPAHIASFYRPESRPAYSRAGSVTTEGGTATPEKLRLMKALQLRKKNMLLNQRTSASTQATSSSHAYTESLASTNTSVNHYGSISTMKSDIPEPLANIDERVQLGTPISTAESPTIDTSGSADPSTTASSFTSQEAENAKQDARSSATSSSVTPRPVAETDRTHQPSVTQESATKLPSPAEWATSGGPLSSNPPDLIHKQEPLTENPVNPVDETYMRLTGSGVGEAAMIQPEEAEQNKLDEEQTEKNSSSLLSPGDVVDKPKRRRREPGSRRVSSAEVSEMSDDDSFMDELQNATVHDAKSISVARSPAAAVLAKVVSNHSRDPSRTLSQMERSDSGLSEKPKFGSIRKGSATSQQQGTEPHVPLTKKATLGQGISKRIKALEVLSTRETGNPPQQNQNETPSARSAFTTFMKRSSLILQQGGSPDNASPERMPDAESMAGQSERPDTDQAWFHRQGSNTKILSPQKGETVSVTARIIRDEHNNLSSEIGDALEVSLHRSPLTVEHDNKENIRPINTKLANHSSVESAAKSPRSERGDKGRFSFSSHVSASQTNIPYPESVGKMTTSSNARKAAPKAPMSDANSFTEEKSKGSRTARLMAKIKVGRRSAKNAISSPPRERGRDQSQHPATIAEAAETGSHASVNEPVQHIVDIGEVNVQFPETLLWKRRFLRIDDHGHIIFSPPPNDANMRGVSRKYHLADFKTPQLPETEREEMAWSIVLDLQDGKRLQCACESKITQQRVLAMLVDAHSAYHQLYAQ